MTYIEFPIPSTYADDAAAGHAGIGIDLLRNNCVELIDDAPVGPASQVNNDYTTGNTTTSTTYDDASVLWRFPFTFIRGKQGAFVRQLRIALWAGVSANTGTIEVCVSPVFRVPAATPVWPDIAKATAVGAVTATPAYHTITFTAIGEEQCVSSVLGAEPAGGAGDAALYYTTFVTIRAKMEAAGTLTTSRLSKTEL